MNVGNVIYHYELAVDRAQTIVSALIRVGFLPKLRWSVTELDFDPQTEVRIHIEEMSCGDLTTDSISRVPMHLWERRGTEEEDLQPIVIWAEKVRNEQIEKERRTTEFLHAEVRARLEKEERAQLEALLKKYPPTTQGEACETQADHHPHRRVRRSWVLAQGWQQGSHEPSRRRQRLGVHDQQ